MNIDSVYFKQKKDIVNSINAFNELEKVRLNYIPKKKVLILNQSNISPDMMNTIRNNNQGRARRAEAETSDGYLFIHKSRHRLARKSNPRAVPEQAATMPR